MGVEVSVGVPLEENAVKSDEVVVVVMVVCEFVAASERLASCRV